MKRSLDVQVGHCKMNLRPTKRRVQQVMDSKLELVPNEIWLMIFEWLIPQKSDIFWGRRNIENLYNCRLVCKKWAKIAEDEKLWWSIISNFGYCGESMWKDLTFHKDSCPWGPRQIYLKPPSFFAQITLRNFKKEDATLELLAKWFRCKRWNLLFQVLSPILTLSHIYFHDKSWRGNGGQYFENFEELYMDNNLFKYGPDIHHTNRYKWKFEEFWGNNICGVSRFYGDCFFVKESNPQGREPSHIVFHCDERGNFLEVRQWLSGSGLNCFSSCEVHPKHIWFGVLCMKELWKGHDMFSHSYDVNIIKVWRQCMTIEPTYNK